MGEIKVSNLSKVTTEEELVDYFRFCGEIDRVRLVEDGEGRSAFIRFRSPRAAETSLFLSGTLFHGRNITITREVNENNNVDGDDEGIEIYCHENENENETEDGNEGEGDKENIKINEGNPNEGNRKLPFESLLEDVIATGQSLSRTMMEKLWELDETYKISEYIKTLKSAVHEKYESSGAAQAMKTAGGTIRDNAVQTWAEALKLLGGESSSSSSSTGARTNYNTFEQ